MSKPRIPILSHPDVEEALFWIAERYPPSTFTVGDYTFGTFKLRTSPVAKLWVRHTKAFQGPRKQRWKPDSEEHGPDTEAHDKRAREGQSLYRCAHGTYPFLYTYDLREGVLWRVLSTWTSPHPVKQTRITVVPDKTRVETREEPPYAGAYPESTFLPPFPLSLRVRGRIVRQVTQQGKIHICVQTPGGVRFYGPMPPAFERLVSPGDWLSFHARLNRRLSRTEENFVTHPRSARLDR